MSRCCNASTSEGSSPWSTSNWNCLVSQYLPVRTPQVRATFSTRSRCWLAPELSERLRTRSILRFVAFLPRRSPFRREDSQSSWCRTLRDSRSRLTSRSTELTQERCLSVCGIGWESRSIQTPACLPLRMNISRDSQRTGSRKTARASKHKTIEFSFGVLVAEGGRRWRSVRRITRGFRTPGFQGRPIRCLTVCGQSFDSGARTTWIQAQPCVLQRRLARFPTSA